MEFWANVRICIDDNVQNMTYILINLTNSSLHFTSIIEIEWNIQFITYLDFTAVKQPGRRENVPEISELKLVLRLKLE